MPLIAQIAAAVAIVVIAAEFYLVYRNRRDRQILEKLNNNSREQ